MDRALNLGRLTEALGTHDPESAHGLPSPEELRELLADAEMRIFLKQTEVSDDLIRTGWYLHGIASASSAVQIYSYPRQRQAFETSAHIFDLALNDERRNRSEKLSLAFGAQIGYRRAELDPNATAIFSTIQSLIIREPPIADHVNSLAVEAGVALLGFQTNTLFELYRRWLSQLRALQRQTGIDDLWGTLFGPSQQVVTGCLAVVNFLAFGTDRELDRARAAFQRVVSEEAASGDLDARWVASHLLDFVDYSESGSVWRLLPPDVPNVARQAFTLTSPAVLTLWPPQRLLFAPSEETNALSADTRRMVLSIPTSSGKTLLAQLLIIVHLARDGGGVCYVAPMRSLGREVRRALRERLRILARELAAELPDFPFAQAVDSVSEGLVDGAAEATLNQLLNGVNALGDLSDVEVMTPERLAHLLRRDPETVLGRFEMFVFDEAHFLAERSRGFTLESILSFLHWRTKSTEHRIVLLSSALGNAGQIMRWIDPTGEGEALRSDWRGPRRLHAIFTTRPDWENGVASAVQSASWPVRKVFPLRGVIRLRPAEGAEPRTLALQSSVGQLALRYNSDGDLRKTSTQTPKDAAHSTPQYKMTARMVAALGTFGSVLVVTSTRRVAQDMARELAVMFEDDPRALSLADMAIQRLGAAHPLSSVLRKGIAFHHAALPADVLDELEEALRSGILKFMTCTSTLTEGVNLPVRTVVLAETQREDSDTLLSGARLVNAMGRAGRAGKESEGWIVLVRAARENPGDFELMSPGHDQLEIRSCLATDEALNELATFEESARKGEDATFAFATGAMGEFLSFVWFILASEEARDIAPETVNLDEALNATLAFAQFNAEARAGWRAAGEIARTAYMASDSERRRRWAQAGTSVVTARQLDDLAVVVVEHVITQLEEEGEAFGEELADPHNTLSLIADTAVVPTLLSLPENDRRWRFRQTRGGQSAEVLVDPESLLSEWIRGQSIPQLADDFLSEVVEQDWRVEQIVDALAQHFEHFLAWTIGVLVELVNSRLNRASVDASLCEELSTFVRYGVDSSLAVRLLVSGVRSRRLAVAIARVAASQGIEGESLRTWLGAMEIQALRQIFNASSSELLDLLEFARIPRVSVLRDLLEQGRAKVSVQAIDEGSGAPNTTDSGPRADGGVIVEVRPIPGDELPRVLGVYELESNALVAVVPTPVHGDVQSILDTGVPVTITFSGDVLHLELASETVD